MDVEIKVSELINKMTLEEKASLCSGKDFWHLKGIERLGIPSIMVTDGPHGLRKLDGISGDQVGLNASVPATCFPSAVTLASSWDRDLLGKVGEYLGDECLQEQVSVLLGPGVNIKRNPLCGRNFEYFSEDPYIGGELAASFINGVQSRGIGTSLKHFAANNQEFFRMTINTVVDERTLRELYLAGFETAVKKSQPWTVMNAYNQVNGVFCSDNHKLLKEILKEEWGHEGLVVTDWGATNDRVEGIKAGLELEMPGSGGINDRKIVEAVNNGTLKESILDDRVSRIIQLILKSEKNLNKSFKYDQKKHHEFARKVAAESIVLLKNEGNLLPLELKGKIALIGDFAENPRYQGAGSSQINPTQLDCALKSIQKMAGDGTEIVFAKGFSTKEDVVDPLLMSEAVNTAESADQIILFAGLPPSFESEGFDREHMRLPVNQLQLIDKILKIKPETIIVLSNGSPVELPFINKSKALIESYLSGQAGGGAVIDIIFGKTVPCGKIAETFPLKLYDVPSYNYFPGTAKQVEYREGLYVGYRYFDSSKTEVLFPFGHGLSYTEFTYSDLKFSRTEINENDDVIVSCTIKNTGGNDGKEIIQLYIRDMESTVYRPEKELKDFKKIQLKKGEKKEISFTLNKRSFAFYDTQSENWQIETGDFGILIGASSRDIRLTGNIKLISSFTALKNNSDHIYKEAKHDIHNIDDDTFEKLLGHKIPETVSMRPFHNNSTITEISTTFIGRQVQNQIKKSFIKMFGEADENTMLMVNSMVNEIPLRSLVLMGGDDFTENKLKGLLLMLNGNFFKGLIIFMQKVKS